MHGLDYISTRENSIGVSKLERKRKEIDNYMTVSEAAYRWGVSENTLKQKLKPYRHKNWMTLRDKGVSQ